MPSKWIETILPEQKSWLIEQLIRGKSLEEVVEGFKFKFRHKGPTLNVELLREFAVEQVPGWMEKTLEKAVEKEIQKVEEEDEPFITKDEGKKINAIRKHRRILKELWENYKRCKVERRAETSKIRYLETMAKEVIILQELERQERSLMSQLDVVRKAEEKETVEQSLDHLLGWVIPQLLRKAKDTENSQFLLELVEKHITMLKGILKQTETVEQAIRVYLNQLYGGIKNNK